MLLLIIFLQLLFTLSQEIKLQSTSNTWSLPPTSEMWIVSEAETLLTLMRDIAGRNRSVLAVASRNISMDSYLVLYLGRFIHWFDNDQFNLSVVLFEKPRKLLWTETVVLLLSQLPPKSIFLSYQHGHSSFGIVPLRQTQLMYNLTPTVVFHLNHEQPWLTPSSTTDNSLDITYNSTLELMEAYSHFPHMFRQYYYTALLTTSQYIPMGPPYYGHLLNNPTHIHYPLLISLTSQLASIRSTLCLFRGRWKYATKYDTNTEDGNKGDDKEYNVNDRSMLFALYNQGLLNDCVFEEAAVLPGEYANMVASYEDYIIQIAQAAFILCPLGNNPETFRLYEALEVQAIPIVMMTTQINSNFLRCKQSIYTILY